MVLSCTVFLLAFSTYAESGSLAPTGLICELLTAPEMTVITNPSPRFGWIVNSDQKNDVQTAYQILICSSRDASGRDTGDVWDSGQVKSGQSTSVPYGGKPLRSNAGYHWKVRTWNAKEQASGYSRAQEFRTGELSDQYVTPRLPLVKEEIAPVRVVEVSSGHAFIDFGKAAFGTVKLTLTSPSSGRKAEVHLGEVIAGEAAINRHPGEHRRYAKAVLPLEEGTRTYTVQLPRDRRNTTGAAILLPPEIGVIMPFRYCEVVGAPGKLDASQVRQIAVHYPFNDEASDFKSSSQVLNDVWELCKYSMKATSFCGVYVDGDRERIPYEADAYINQLGHYCVDREYAMGRYTDEYLIVHPTWPTEWIMHSVLLAWADYEYTGDPRSLVHFYKDLQAKTLSALAREDGLISTQTGLLTDAVLESVHFKGKMKDIVDWPHGNQGGVNAQSGETDGYEFLPINTVVNAFHIRSLALMGRIAEVLGRTADARRYRDQAARVLQVFNEKLIDKAKGVYVDGEGSRHSSLHANMFPLAFGLVPERFAKGVADFVAGRGMACSVYGSQYLLESLYNADRAEHALKLLTARHDRSWFNMIKVGSTITLEAWDNKYKPEQDWNHAWGAAPANIIPRLLMGVEPLEPVFGKIRIRPQPANLEWAKLKLPTIRGTVHVDFKQELGKSFVLNVNIPANATAVVYLPRLADDRVAVTMDGVKRQAAPEGQFFRIDGVGSGTHSLEARVESQ
jgi:hypothetical protein